MRAMRPRFNLEDANRAFEEWGMNCGPGAIAAIAHLTLDEVRPHLGPFESKRYTNPTLMHTILHALHNIGHIRSWAKAKKDWPNYGLVRIQWEGPWMAPEVSVAVSYRHTHWVGAARDDRGVGVFDINCIKNGSGWVSLDDWTGMLVPWLLKECVPRASGGWHITHAIEVKLPKNIEAMA